jgi:YebC/PmpR family DNA-binding regulatory protein
MAGHSKWANRVHRKTRQDKKRAKTFSKLSRMIQVAAREGGGDPEWNPSLRMYMDKAKEAEMPKDNIERAIKAGTGELEGVNYEPAIYEGYGPTGVAMIVKVLTDNNKRTVAEIRNIMKEHGGNLGDAGSVTWMFESKGVVTLPMDETDYDEVFLIAADAGADDIIEDEDEDLIEVRCGPRDLTDVYEALKDAGFETKRSELTMIPNATHQVSDDDAPRVMKLLDRLNDHDDVEQIYSNFEISDEAMEAYDVAS